jgi:hypothetical protein
LNAHGILQGGTVEKIHPGQILTDAQAAAVDQVLSSGHQSIILNSLGEAVGGVITLRAGSISSVSSLVVPTKVTVDALGFSSANPLQISGSTQVSGSLIASQKTSTVASVLDFSNLTVSQGGTVSDVLPKSLTLLSNLMSASGLTLNVTNNVVNRGTISSGTALNINVGGTITNQSASATHQALISAPTVSLSSQSGNIKNSGSITATSGNLQISSPNNLTIANAGGTLSAPGGQINFRDASFAGASNLTITGGNINTNALNLYSGTGNVVVNVDTLNGTVNATAATAHVTAATSNLNLGVFNLSGDPTFYDTTGNITITAPLVFANAPVAIVAHGDVTFSAAATSINTSGTSGGNILIAAGVNFSSTGPPASYNDTTSALTITSGVPGGGAILGSSLTTINSSATAAGGTGGNVIVTAFGGLNNTAGAINLSNAAITAGGNGSGASGTVLIVGGSQRAGNNVQVKSISTLGGAAGTGNITVAAATPVVNGPVIVAAGGNISSGSFSAGTNAASNVLTGALSANGANITLAAGSAATPANVQVTGAVTNTRTGAGAGGTVTVNVNSSNAFLMGAASTNGISGNILVNNTATGLGGSLLVTNSGTGGISLNSTANISVAASAGSGGTVNLNSTNGTLALPGGTISASGVGAAANGGSITLNGSTVAITGGPLILQASGSGTSTGNGGTVSVTATAAASNLSFGNGAGQIEVQANSGSTSGNAGTISASAGGNLTANPTTGLIDQPLGTSGNGAIISLTAGSNGSGNLSIANTISANAATGGGNGGSVTLLSNSATAFTITNSAQTNGINGSITANGGGVAGNSGGSITVENLGSGGINLALPANVTANGGAAGGAGGNITLNATAGTLSSGAGTLNANAVGPGSYNGGNIVLNGSALNLSGAGTLTTSANGAGGGNGGSVSVTMAGGNIPIGNTNGNLIISATGGSLNSSSGNGGTVNVTSANGNVTVNNPAAFVVGPLGTNGSGSNITLQAGSSGTGNLFVNGSLSANGMGTGGAGNIALVSSSSTTFTVGTGAATNGVNGTITAAPGANAGTAATIGGVTVTNLGSGGITLLNTTVIAAPAPTGGGNAGYITLAAPAGALTIPSGTIASNAVGNGNGGNITLSAMSLSATMPLAFSANAAGTGNGGNISLTVQASTALNVDAADLSFSATGGATSGNGGSVTVSNGGNVTANPAAIKVNPNATGGGGNGGKINLSAGTAGAGQLLVTGPIAVNGVGAGNGGQVTLSSNTSSGDPFIVSNPTDNGVEGTITANAGATGGAGGSISLNNTGAGGVQLSSTSVLSANATNGNGGNLSITSAAGPVNIPPGTFNVSAAGSGNFSGGNVNIVGTTINVTPNTGSLNIVSNGLGSGNAGMVNLDATAAGSTLNVGTGNGEINIQGHGGTNAGAASPVTISTGGNLTVDPTSLDLVPGTNGNGANLTLCAGMNGAGNLLVTGSIDVSGNNSGNGGSVTLCSSSATPFYVNSALLTTNGVAGTIKANGGPTGGNGGSVTILANGTTGANGGIALNGSGDISFSPNTNGAGGNLTLNAINTGGTSGPITIPAGTYNANAAGSGSYNGGAINIQGSVINDSAGNVNLTANGSGSGNGGSITAITNSSSGNISIGTGAGNLTVSATGGSTGSAAGSGGTVTVSSGGNLTVNTAELTVSPQGSNGNGGNISLTDATAATTGTMAVTGNLNANAVGTGNGGTINISYKDATNPLTVGSAPTASGVNGNITANAPGSGNGGTITISNSASNSALAIDLTTASAAITASAATASTTNVAPYGTLNFNQPGQAVSVTGPGTIDGLVNSNASSVNIDPTASGTVVTVGSITATSGNATISSPNGTVNVPLGNTASATGNINVGTNSLLINGTLTSSGSAASVNVTSSGNLLVSGQGLIQVSGAGANSITVAAAPGNTLTLNESPTYATGAAGSVLFSATGANGQIIMDAGTNQNIRDGNPAEISTPSLVFQNGAAFTARGATVFNVDSGPSVDNQPLAITIPASGTGLIDTNGGSINIGPSASGQPLTYIASGGIGGLLSLDGGPVTMTVNNAAATVSTNVNVVADHNITINANSGSLINNGVISTSMAAGTIAVQSNAALTVGGTGTISTTGGGATAISVTASFGTTNGNPLDFTGSQTFDAGTGTGAAVTFSSPNCPPGPATMGSINLSANAIETVASGVPLSVITPTLTMGNNSQIADTATTGVGVNIVSGGNCPLDIIAPSTSSATISTSGGTFNIAPGPVGGPVPTGEALTFDQSTSGSTATLNFMGGAVTTTVNGANTTSTTGTTVLANNTITMNVNNGNLVDNGVFHSTTATGAAGTINVLSTGTLGLQGVGNVTVDPTAVGGGAGGTINVTAASTLSVSGGNLTANAITNGNGGKITVQATSVSVSGATPLTMEANAAGTGNGGTIGFTTTGATGDITVGSTAGGLIFEAEGGTTSGNGGTVNVSAGRNLDFASGGGGSINVTPQSLTGNGGTVTLTASTAAAGTLTLNPPVNANGPTGGTGNGGKITVTDNSTNLLQIPAGVLSANSGTVGGIGGQVSVTNTQSGGIELEGNITATGVSNTGSGVGQGGQITIATGGNVLLDGGSLNVNGVTGAASSGGTVSITAASISQAAASTESLTANANGTGNGGIVNLTTTASGGNITLGPSGGTTLNVQAEGGSTGSASGNGGAVNVTSAAALSILSSASINVAPQGNNGNGGSITLKGSTVTASTLTLSANLNANGVGAGNGGLISVTNNSSNLLQIPDSVLSANSGATSGIGGKISVTNTGSGGIELEGGISATGVSNTAPTAGNSGQITVNSGGNVQLDGGTLNVNGVTGASSTGGTITVTAASISQQAGSTESLTANANGTGNGGVVNLTTSAAGGNITLGTSGGTTFQVAAEGGSTGSASGNGGAVNISSAAGLSILSDASINVAPQGNNGNGGSITLTGSTVTSSTLALSADLNASGIGAGNGGTISITNNSSSPEQLQAGLLSANSGGTSGIGGKITVTNTGTGGIVLADNLSATGVSNTAPTAGNSGQITVTAGGNVSLGGGTINASGVTGAASSGGAISVTAASISQTASTTEVLEANASGTANGGKVTLTTTAAGGNITLGSNGGSSLTIDAEGGSAGSASGNGGNVTVSSAGALSMQSGAVNVTPQGNNGNGGTISLTASTVTPSAMTIDTVLNANGIGTGSGGAITMTDNSSFQLVVPAGMVSATSGTSGGTGGQITVTNTGSGGSNGGISVADLTATGVANTALTFGQITVNAGGSTPGAVTLTGGALNAGGTGSGNSYGGSVSITGSTFTNNAVASLTANATGTGNGGTVSVTTLGAAGNISVGTGATALTLSATGGSTNSASGNGGTVSLSAGAGIAIATGAAINVNPQGNNGTGGSVLLTAGTAAAGTVQIGQGIAANGAGTGNGGIVSIKVNDPTAQGITVGSTSGTGGYVEGNITADASPASSGNGGTVTIQNSAAAALNVLLNGGNISANQGATGSLGNINFPTSVATPQTVSVTGNGNLTGLVNSNGTLVLIYPQPSTATTLTVGQITATTSYAAAEVNCSNGSLLNIPVGSKIQTTASGGADVGLMGTTVTNNGQVVSTRDVYIQTGTLQGSGTYTVPRDLNISACMPGSTLTVNLPGVALTAGRNVNFDVNFATPGPISVTAASISANAGAGLVQLNPGQYTATVTATSINGLVEDPNYATQPSDTINITVNSAAIPLKVGDFNASFAATSTFVATNQAAGGSIQTVGPITANGTVANPVTLTADNITNNNAVTANLSNLLVQSSAAGRTLNVAMNGSGSLAALAANVNFNGTASANAGSISVTGTGTIVADGSSGTNGIVNLNMGSGTASVAATSIVGCVEDPNYPTNKSGTVTIAVTADGSGGGLMVGNFNATGTAASAFSAVNSAVGGHLSTCGNITANGATALILGADNVTNANTITANTSDLSVNSGHTGDTLTVNNTGNLTAAAHNVDFNGTVAANEGSVQVTGTGTISADAGSGFINLNIGTGTANVVQGTIAGCVQDPNANFATPNSGTVSVSVSSATTLQMGNFASTTSVTGVNSGDVNGNGNVSVCGNVDGTNAVTLTASGSNGNITEMTGGIITTGATGLTTLLANGPIGIGVCPTNLVLLNTPNINANASNGSVALSDSAAVTITGSNSASAEYHITDTASATPAISFASGSSLSANEIILYASNGGMNLSNANVSITGSGTAELVANTSITGSPTNLSGGASATLEIASLTGSVGTNVTPVTFNIPNFSATAVQGSVYMQDSSTGNVTIVSPPSLSPCGPVISSPNTSLNNYFVVAANSSGNALLTGSGVTVTGGDVALISQNGSVGTSATPISTAATMLTANAANGPVYVADNNGTNGVTLSPNTVFGTAYSNSGTTNFNLTESGNGPLNINNNVSATAVGGQINLTASGGTNGNIIEQSGTLTTNGGASGSVILSASGTVGIGVCPTSLVLLNTPTITANAVNGSVALSDSTATTIAGSNVASSEFHLTDTAAANPAISFASGSSISANVLILYAPNGGINLNNASLTITGSGTAEIVANNSIISEPTGLSIGSTGTLVIASLTGSIGASAAPLTFNIANFSATATQGSVYIQDNYSGNVTIVTPPNLAPCGPVIASPNTALNNYFVVAANGSGNALLTGSGARVTGGNVALISLNGSVGTSASPISTAATTITANAANGPVYVADNNGTNGVTLSPNTVYGTPYSNGGTTNFSLTESGNGVININNNVSTTATGSQITLSASGGTNGNIVEQSGTLTTNGGASGNVNLFASGTVGIGVCPTNLVLTDTPTLTANAPNGSVAVHDSTAVTVTGSNSASFEYHINDSSAASPAISFASGSTISANELILLAPNGGMDLTNANVTLSSGGVAELVANASITGSPTNISGATSTLEIASLNGSIGTSTTPVVVGTPNLSATATNGSVYMEDNNSGNVSIVLPPDLAPCGIVINNPNQALTNFFLVATNAPGTALLTGAGATITAATVALISQDGSVGTSISPISTVTSTLTANAGNGTVYVSDSNGSTGVTVSPTTVFGTAYSNGAKTYYNVTENGNGPININDNVSTTAAGSQITLTASGGSNGNIIEQSGTLTTDGGASGSVVLFASGTVGIGVCPNNLVLLDTPGINANALNGSVALHDTVAAIVMGSNTAANEFHINDSSSSNSAISFASFSFISANEIILYAPNGGMNLANANISITGSGVAELVANTSITGIPMTLSGGTGTTLEIASLTGSIGNNTTPLTFNIPNFSATAVQGSVYMQDNYTGNVTIVTPPNLSPCGPVIANPNTALNNFFVVAANSSGNALLTGSGVTVTGNDVALISQNGSVGTSANPISTAATMLTANAANGPVYVADNNGTTGVTLSPNTVFGTPYSNGGTTNFNLTESGNGPININNNVSTTAPGSQINLSASGGTNGNIVEQSGILTTNGGASGSVNLFASGTVGIGVCPNNLVLLNTPTITANAPNGSVALSDSAAAVITGSNSASAEFHLTDTAAATPAISFASGSSISANELILYAPNGGVNLANASITITGSGVAEIVSSSSITGVPTNLSIGATGTLEIASLTGSIGGSATPLTFNIANFSATAAQGSVYIQDNYAGNVTIVTPPNLSPCGPVIANPNTALNDYFVVAANSSSTALQTGAGATITGSNVALISQNGSVGTSVDPISTAAAKLTANAANGPVYVADNNGTNGVTISPNTVFGTPYSNSGTTNYSLTENGNGPININGNIATTSPNSQINLSASGGTNGNIVEQSGTLTTNGGTSGGANLYASGTVGIGVCPTNLVLLSTPNLTANAPNGSVALSDSVAAVLTGSNSASAEFHLDDSASALSAISFAASSSISANTVILLAPNGGMNLNSANITLSSGGVAELVANTSITGSPTNITGISSTLEIASLTGSIGTSSSPVIVGTPNLSATAANGSVYMKDNNVGNVTIVLPPDLAPCGVVINNPNTALNNFYIVTTNSPGTALQTGTGVTITAPTVALISQNGSVGTAGSPVSIVSNTITANAGNGLVNVSDNNGATGVTIAPNTIFGTPYTNGATGSYTLTDAGTGALTNNDNLSGGAGVTLNAPGTFNNNGTVTAPTGNVTIQSTAVGNVLTVNTVSGSAITATTGDVNFNSPGNPGAITVTGGATGGTIAAGNDVNFYGGTGAVITDNKQISGGITVAGSSVNMTTAMGNLDIVQPINTSSGTGSGGAVTLTANGGSVSTRAIDTDGSGTGNSAGTITITGATGANLGNINANGNNGAGGGTVTVTAPTIAGTYVDATGSGAGSGGTVNLTSNNLTLSGEDGSGNSVNTNANGTGNGGIVNITTNSNNPFQTGNHGAATGNGIDGNIAANGVNGGFITLTNAGNLINYGNIVADGTTGNGGTVLIQNSFTPGSKPLVVQNYGLINADNSANNNGLIGLNGGPNLNIYVQGTGSFIAGTCVHIGNLNQTTLDFLNPPAGNIYTASTLTFEPHICARSPINPVTPPNPPTPPAPPAPPNGGGSNGGGSGNGSSTGNSQSQLQGFLSFFGSPESRRQARALSLTPTDTTQVFNITNLDQSPLFPDDIDYKTEPTALIKGAKTYEHEFAANEQSRLQSEGVLIASNTAHNYFNLDRGNVLFNPSQNIVVGTHEGNVYIGPGSHVLVMETGHDVIIYNLHDDAPERVSIVAANKKLVLEPGRILVLTRQKTNNFESLLTPCHGIGYRNIKQVDLDNSIKAFYGDFSIPSALTIVVPLKKLLSSNDPRDKRTLERIIKTSSMLSTFSPQNSPFRNGAMFR